MKASELISVLQGIIEQEGIDPVCCRETAFSGPSPVVSALLESQMQGRAILSAKAEPLPPVIVIW
jgi:hypothetical protein